MGSSEALKSGCHWQDLREEKLENLITFCCKDLRVHVVFQAQMVTLLVVNKDPGETAWRILQKLTTNSLLEHFSLKGRMNIKRAFNALIMFEILTSELVTCLITTCQSG